MPNATCESCEHALKGHGPQGCAECLLQESAGTRNVTAVCGRTRPATSTGPADALSDEEHMLDTLMRMWRASLLLMLVGGVVIGGTYLVDPDLSAPISKPLAVGTALCLGAVLVVLGTRSLWESVERVRARSKDGSQRS